MNGVMDYNWLGIAFLDDDLPEKTKKKVEAKMEELKVQMEEFEEKINVSFDQWLSENQLERTMGVIIKKEN
ncbi:MAG: hypothetical protein ACLU79_14900 [Clostridium sp.]|jgi:hypothetical protein